MASASQPAAAAHIVAERGPAYMRAELISGGNSTKSGNIRDLFSANRNGRCDQGRHPMVRTSSNSLRKQLTQYVAQCGGQRTRLLHRCRTAIRNGGKTRLSLTTRVEARWFEERRG